MIKNGLHDVFSPDKLIKFRGASKFPSQQQDVEETGIVDGRTEYVVLKIRAHRDVFPRGKAPKEGKRLFREYLVQWKGDPSKGSWTWKRVEDLNDGGVLGPWLDYEAALMRHDPAKASQSARETIPQHIGGADRGQDIRPDDRTRAAEARFAAETKSSSAEVLRPTEPTRDALRPQPRPPVPSKEPGLSKLPPAAPAPL